MRKAVEIYPCICRIYHVVNHRNFTTSTGARRIPEPISIVVKRQRSVKVGTKHPSFRISLGYNPEI